MDSRNPSGLLDRLLAVCVGLLVCVVALTIALCLLARIWYWLVLLAAVGFGVYFLARWLRDRYERW